MRLKWKSICFLLLVITVMIPMTGYAEVENKEGNYTIILQRMYISGDASEEIMTKQDIKPTEIVTQYHDWALIYCDDEQYVFLKKINDISPFMKKHGFFGITEDGFFHIYEMSLERKKVIQSFFHVDTKKLEALKREQFKKGIRVHSKKQYMHVIHEMKKYRK
ncbi:MAG: BofC C-terminal domain-containing protein [Bacillaceae bacterium]